MSFVLPQARQEAQEAKRKALLNSLFEMWDNDGSGNIDFEEVETIMKKYKEGQESDAINQGGTLHHLYRTMIWCLYVHECILYGFILLQHM